MIVTGIGTSMYDYYNFDKKIVTKPIQKAMPSLTHMAFVAMLE
jgi:hypothetical protein